MRGHQIRLAAGMEEEERIKNINQVISDYFENSTKENTVAVKELMPFFITAGLFTTDHKRGLPIRKVLRELDEQNALDKIPSVHAERKDKSTFWYFVRPGNTYVSDTPNDTGVSKKQKAKASRAMSDEYYIINLCNELLDASASRQHKFGFLLGDYHKDGKTRSVLPVDAYYEDINLVVEFLEKEHTESAYFIDKAERKTISGVSRGEQRKIYELRRRRGLKGKDINLIEIDYSSFECDSKKNLIRDKEKDLDVLRTLLKGYL